MNNDDCGDKIACLICGRLFHFLGTHLKRAHGISATEYRDEFGLSSAEPLASRSYRNAHVEKIRRMQADGRMNYTHLPEATEAARSAGRGRKSAEDRDRQVEIAKQLNPAPILPPGAKRADGRDADRMREYQRAYRAKKRGNGTLMDQYRSLRQR